MKLFLLLILTLSCKSPRYKNIIIIGTAENAKAGAVVVSNKDQAVYYLDGKAFWDEAIVGKVVKVSGKLLIEKSKASKQGKDIAQQITGKMMLIAKPKWVLLEMTNADTK